jgi:hypothetical protein
LYINEDKCSWELEWFPLILLAILHGLGSHDSLSHYRSSYKQAGDLLSPADCGMGDPAHTLACIFLCLIVSFAHPHAHFGLMLHSWDTWSPPGTAGCWVTVKIYQLRERANYRLSGISEVPSSAPQSIKWPSWNIRRTCPPGCPSASSHQGFFGLSGITYDAAVSVPSRLLCTSFEASTVLHCHVSSMISTELGQLESNQSLNSAGEGQASVLVSTLMLSLQDLTWHREEPKKYVLTSSWEKQAILSLNQISVTRILTLVPPCTLCDPLCHHLSTLSKFREKFHLYVSRNMGRMTFIW